MSDEQNGYGLSRLDRIEGLLRLLIDDHLKFTDDYQMLLTAQVLQEERLNKLTDGQKDMEARLNALILTVDDLIRGLPG